MEVCDRKVAVGTAERVSLRKALNAEVRTVSEHGASRRELTESHGLARGARVATLARSGHRGQTSSYTNTHVHTMTHTNYPYMYVAYGANMALPYRALANTT